MLTCFSKKYLGVECPGCGIQRSFLELIHGDFMQSIALYPALIPFIISGVFLLLHILKVGKHSLKLFLGSILIASIISIGHYILKITGNAPWYFEAAKNFCCY